MFTENSKQQGRQSAEEYFRDGVQAYNDGKLEEAMASFARAEKAFSLRGDFKRAGDSRTIIARIASQNDQFEQSISSYRQAIQLYRDAGCREDEAGCELALGYVKRQLGYLEQAEQDYLIAQSLYQSLQHLQGLGHVALALGDIEMQRAHLPSAAHHYQESMASLRAAADPAEIDALGSLANIQRLMGSFSEAEVNCQLAREKYHACEDSSGEINALTGLGWIYLDAERLDAASASFAEAFRLARDLEDEQGEADASLGLAEVSLRQNRLEQALLEAQDALSMSRSQQYHLGMANAQRVLAEVYLRNGPLSSACSLMEQAIKIYSAQTYPRGLARAKVGLGEIQRRRGQLIEARRFFQEGREEAHRLGTSLDESRALLGLGDICLQQGQFEQAKQLFMEAKATAERASHPDTKAALQHSAEVELDLGSLALLSRDLGEAERHLATADEMITQHALDGAVVPRAALTWGRLFQAQGHVVQAETCFREAQKQAEAVQEPLLAAEALLGLASIQQVRHEPEEALETFQQARRRFQWIEHPGGEEAASSGIAQINREEGQ